MSVFPGDLKPKNQLYADIVEQERERVRMRQEPQNSVGSKKAAAIRIAGACIFFTAGIALLVWFFGK